MICEKCGTPLEKFKTNWLYCPNLNCKAKTQERFQYIQCCTSTGDQDEKYYLDKKPVTGFIIVCFYSFYKKEETRFPIPVLLDNENKCYIHFHTLNKGFDFELHYQYIE